MNEIAKTLIFCVVATAIGLLAWLGSPGPSSTDDSGDVRERIFTDFTEEAEIGALEIVRVNDDNVDIETFRVELRDAVWSIPSHGNYPADAKDQIVSATSAMRDLEIVGVVSKHKSEEAYRRYGVMPPTLENLIKFGSDTIGLHATMTDLQGNALADLTIGKEVKENPQLRYARVADQDRVVTIQFDLQELSSNFGEWIETDLLKLTSPSDIRRIKIKDYSTEVTPGPTPFSQPSIDTEQQGDIRLAYDSDSSKWNAIAIKAKSPNASPASDLVDANLTADEELNDDKLRELRDALNDLKIINVERKPTSFNNLTIQDGEITLVGQQSEANEIVLSLAKRGFYFEQVEKDGKPTIIVNSSDGEVECTMKDGVRYMLRFGDIESLDTGSSDETAAHDKDPASDDDTKLNRYMFVMAEFDSSIIPPPEILPIPTAKAEPETAKPEATDAENAEPKTNEENPPESTDDATATEGASSDETQNEAADDDTTAETTDADTTSDSETKVTDNNETPPKVDPKAEAEEARKKLEAEIERVKNANEAAKKAYEEKLAAGKKRVRELNERFADWFYVISDDIYKKIHLSRDDIVKQKEKAEESESSGAGNPPGHPFP